jgi:hypothetical protein
LVSKPILNQSRVATFHGERMPTGTPESERVRVFDAAAFGCRLEQLGEPVARERPTLQHEHVFVRLPIAVERPQRPQVCAIERLACVLAVLGPGHGNVNPLPVDRAPAQIDELGTRKP